VSKLGLFMLIAPVQALNKPANAVFVPMSRPRFLLFLVKTRVSGWTLGSFSRR
jgi:hypothetical protein